MLSSELHLSDLPHLNLQSCETDLYPGNKTILKKSVRVTHSFLIALCAGGLLMCSASDVVPFKNGSNIYTHVNMAPKNTDK